MDRISFDDEDVADFEVLEAPPIFEDEEARENYLADQARRLTSDDHIKTTMMRFFKGKRSKEGVLLTELQVCTQENIELVRELSVTDAIDVLYSALEENGFVGTDFVFCMRLQNELSRCGILKAYSGGMMVVYLKVVMGYEL